jgi:Glycosyl hydrolases family 43
MRHAVPTRPRKWLVVKVAVVIGALGCIAQLAVGPLHIASSSVAATATTGRTLSAVSKPTTGVRVKRLPPTELIAHATLAAPAAHPHESTADFPDPFVMHTPWDYIAYATNNRDGNVPMRRSADLRAWVPAGDALPKLPGWATAGGTWAPSVLPVGNHFVMYVALHTTTGHECVATAVAPNPLGPFRIDNDITRACIVWDAIDASPFVDTDGSKWLLFKIDTVPYRIDAQRMSADGAHLEGPATTILRPTMAWEAGNVEGPSLARRDGTLFLLYSANDYRTTGYRIGVATCATPAGPCQASPQPFLTSGGGIEGPGGAEWVRDGATATDKVGFAAWQTDSGPSGPVRGLRVIDTHVRQP